MDKALDLLATFWPILVTVVHLGGAVAVTAHAVLRKHDPGATIAWVGVAWLAPVLGSLLYLVLGINRLQRKGVALGLAEAWHHDDEPQFIREDQLRVEELRRQHPTFAGLAQLGHRVTEHPVLPGNLVTPLVDGDAAYPRMLAAIDQAEKSVALLSYIFDADRAGKQFLEALARARDRGVEVRVLIDGVGSRYSKPSMVDLLRRAGIQVAAFLPSRTPRFVRYANLRNHRKILVADGHTGFTGGTNIREGHWLGLDPPPQAPVKCLHFQIRGPVVAELQETFAIDWAFTTGESLVSDVWFPPLQRHGQTGARGIPDGPDEDLDKMSEVILGALAAATQRVRIITPYFLPDFSIQRALIVTAMRGVEVDIVIPEHNNIAVMNWAVVPQLPFLIRKGCRIHFSPGPFDHTKLFLVDGIWSLIGSTNWDARSLRLNFEFNVECYDPHLTRRLEKIVDERIATARPVTIQDLENRHPLAKLRDGTARLLSPYL